MAHRGCRLMPRLRARCGALATILATSALLTACSAEGPARFGSPTAVDQLRQDALMSDPWLAPDGGLVARGSDSSGTVSSREVGSGSYLGGGTLPATDQIALEAEAAGRAGWWPFWVDCENEIRLAKELPDGSFATAQLWVKDGDSLQVEVRIPSAAITQPVPPPAIDDLNAACPSSGVDVELVPEAYAPVVGQIMGG